MLAGPVILPSRRASDFGILVLFLLLLLPFLLLLLSDMVCKRTPQFYHSFINPDMQYEATASTWSNMSCNCFPIWPRDIRKHMRCRPSVYGDSTSLLCTLIPSSP